jgi:hypothetical protein
VHESRVVHSASLSEDASVFSGAADPDYMISSLDLKSDVHEIVTLGYDERWSAGCGARSRIEKLTCSTYWEN